MNIFKIAGLLAIGFCFSITAQHKDSLRFEGEKHLKNIKMITNEKENAEAYLSFDETQLIFQSTAQGQNCDQIFTMDIDGKNKKLITGGKGRTTCSYFLPGDKKIIYASTQATSAECPPPPDMSQGYVWKLYESFELFIANADGSDSEQITKNDKYDAEATVSPMGDKIVFTSLRDGDPELYLMDIDGSNQKRLTFEKGYDGGAFFSQDGKKIVFRASRPKTEKELTDYDELVKDAIVRPSALEIYVMDSDGKSIKQITNYKCASFAPFFHPDGKRIIFSSNYGSTRGRDFNLFIINIDGTGLEKVTDYDQFDGFPMFTKDGKKLIFASNRFGLKKGDTNIFVADWID